MGSLREIKKRITSVTSTRQITRTMQMVAAAKIRKATERVNASTPYSESMMEMLASVARSSTNVEHPLLDVREEKKRATFVLVTSDRGLAGGFNTLLLRDALKEYKKLVAEGIDVDFIACGKKAISFCRYNKLNIVLKFEGLSADPTLDQARAISTFVSDQYANGETDDVVIYYNHARNAATQDIREEQLLPVDTTSFVTATEDGEPDTSDPSCEFEPDAETVLGTLLPAYILTTVYYALIDSAAAEQGARRKAMKSATDNANEIISTLNRVYNRARQAAITTELTEIIAGAAALDED